MAPVWKSMVVLMVVAMAAAIGRVSAQLPDCANQLIGGLSGCFDAVTNPTTNPSAECCKGVADVVKNQLKCLCEVYNSKAAAQTLNMTRVLEIPVLCKVAADVSLCKTGGSSTNTTAKSAPSPASPSAPAPTAGAETKKNGALRLTWSLKPLWALGLLWASLLIMP